MYLNALPKAGLEEVIYNSPLNKKLDFVSDLSQAIDNNMTSSILLKNGTLLLHDSGDVVRPINADLMIENTRIVAIAQNIDVEVSRPARIIDCTAKIISPGFVDTHHHVWQTCLKGTHVDETLFNYFPSG